MNRLKYYTFAFLGLILYSITVVSWNSLDAQEAALPAVVAEEIAITPQATTKANPNLIEAEAGVYVKSFGKFDYSHDSLFINFYLWLLVDKDSKFKPEETMEITNAQQYTQLWGTRDMVGDKVRIQARYYGTINHYWDMKYFPFDRQKIRVSMENNEGDAETIQLKVLPNTSKISPDIKLRGWKLVHFDFTSEDHKYNNNFGDISKDHTITSRLNMFFELKRDGWRLFFVYFIGYISAMLLCVVTFFVPKYFFGETIIICLGAIFAGMGNKYQLDSSVSEMNISGISLTSVLTICTFAFILITTINTVLTQILYIYKKEKLSFQINYSVLFMSLLIYGTIVGTVLQLAINS